MQLILLQISGKISLFMKKLIEGIIHFREGLTEEKRKLFAKLAIQQKPDALFIACSDSRVVPNLFASTDPGDLFVLRNVGNLIPPFTSDHDNSAAAVIEFSIFSLKVSNIVICGHSECGAMRALENQFNDPCCPHLIDWLKHGASALQKVKHGQVIDGTLSIHNQISQMNVLEQIENIKTYPFIQERISQGTLQVHGWWFDIGRADVYCYEPAAGRFILIDEQEAKLILKRLVPDHRNPSHSD